jgi:hypothetical protein
MLIYFTEKNRPIIKLKNTRQIKEACDLIDQRLNYKCSHTDISHPEIQNIINSEERTIEIDSFAYNEKDKSILFVCPVFKYVNNIDYFTLAMYPEMFEEDGIELLKKAIK